MSVMPASPLAPPRGVDLWSVPLRQPRARIAELIADCSEAEHARAGRMRLTARACQFLAARGIVRTVLGAYVAIDAAGLPLGVGAHGKPFVDLPEAPAFNVTHSGERLIVAVTASFAVGVDVERVDPRLDVEAIASRFLPGDETAELLALPPVVRNVAFLRLWTRREALLKARGCGFATSVSDAFGPLSRLRDSLWDGICTLTDLDAGPGYVGALAYHAPPTALDNPDRALLRL